jgi:hypothetical protein
MPTLSYCPGTLTLIVDGTNGNDDTAKGTAALPYKTIQAAINSIPKLLAGSSVYVRIKAGTYDAGSGIVVEGLTGGECRIVPFSGAKDVEIIGTNTSNSIITLRNIRSRIVAQYLKITGPGKEVNISALNSEYCSGFDIAHCEMKNVAIGLSTTYDGGGYIVGSIFENAQYAISANNNGDIVSQNNTSEGNVDYGLAVWTATIRRSGAQPTGLIANERISSGGQII